MLGGSCGGHPHTHHHSDRDSTDHRSSWSHRQASAQSVRDVCLSVCLCYVCPVVCTGWCDPGRACLCLVMCMSVCTCMYVCNTFAVATNGGCLSVL